MKKVKTLIASLAIILATAFMSACSCGGGNSSDPIIPVTSITITSDFSGATQDEESKYLEIRCNVNQEFKITYHLNPENTTRTQVDWGFVGSDGVVASKNNRYTYSQSANETVTFVAKRVGNTIIKFTPKNTDKWTQATVIVGEAPEAWPTFVAPANLDYNMSTGKVTWDAVKQIRLNTGKIENVSIVNGNISGFTGYVVSYTNLETNETVVASKDENGAAITKCEFELPRGNSYSVQVYARGDNFTTKDSEYSDKLKFHQLFSVQELQNNDGIISFKTSKYAQNNEVYYTADKLETEKITRTSANGEKVQFKANEHFKNTLSEYNVSVVSYPENYDSSKKFVLDEATQIRYYPSVSSETITIQNLYKPTIKMNHNRSIIKVGGNNGVVFGDESSDYNPFTNTTISWNITEKTYSNIYQIGYKYKLFKDGVEVYPYTVGSSLDCSNLTSGNYKLEVVSYGLSSNTITSPVATYEFVVLNAVSKSTTTISNNLLTTSEANATLSGVELFLLKISDANDYISNGSVYKFVSGEDNGVYNQKTLVQNLVDLNLTPGRYDIYARFVGVPAQSSAYKAGTIGEITKVNDSPLVVASPVNNSTTTLNNSGIVKFAKVSGVANYKITVQKDNEIFERQIVSVEDSTYTANKVYRDFENLKYTTDGNNAYVSIFDVIANYLIKENRIIEDSSMSYENRVMASVNNFIGSNSIKFTIASKGMANFGLDSQNSDSVEFTRLPSVNTNTITLNNYTLSFKTSQTNITYYAQIGEYITQVNGRADSVVSIDLNREEVNKYVNKNGYTQVKVWAEGSTANTSSMGFLDSFESYAEFGCASVPTDLSIDKDCNLSWNIDGFQGTQRFVITILKYVNGEWIEAVSPFPVDTSRVENSTEEDSGNPTPVANAGKFVCNIANEITGDLVNQTLAITISHQVSDRFNNVASDKYFVIRLASVSMNKVMLDGAPAIAFDSLTSTTGITYYLSVIENGTPWWKVIEYTTGGTFKISEIKIEPTADELAEDSTRKLQEIKLASSYKLVLYAGCQTNGENSQNTPFILSSESTELDIQIMSASISAYAQDENIYWNSIHENATYTLFIKASGDTEYTVVQETVDGNLTDKVFDITSANGNVYSYNVYNLFRDGKNYVQIKPIIDWQTTGCILVDEIKENTIIKVLSAQNIQTQNGVITFETTENLTDKNYSIRLFIDGKEIDSTIGAYAVSFQTVLEGENFSKIIGTINILGSTYVGEHIYQIQILAQDRISSAVSSDTFKATKIEAPADLTKESEWIIWTHTPNASAYELTLAIENGGQIVKSIKYDEATNKASFAQDDGTYLEDETIVKVVEGKIYYKFDETTMCTEAGNYYLTVTPFASKSGYLNGSKSAPYKITKLNNVTIANITADGESIAIGGYENVDQTNLPTSVHYEISRYETITTPPTEEGGESTTTISKVTTISGDIEYSNQFEGENKYLLNLNDMGILTAGSYMITLKFVGNNNNILTSQVVENANFTKLEKPNVSTVDGNIAWATIENSKTYTIKITKVDVTEDEPSEWTFVVNATSSSEETPASSTQTISESELILEDGTQFTFEVQKRYTVEVMANGDSLSSTWSQKFTVKKLQAPNSLNVKTVYSQLTYIDQDGNEQTLVDKDGNAVQVGDPMLTWNNPNTNKNLDYILSIGDQEPIEIKNVSGEKLLGYIIPKDLPVSLQAYEFRLKIVGNTTTGTDQIGLLTSSYSGMEEGSTNPKILYVNETSDVFFSNNSFGWKAVTGAYGYELKFYKGYNKTDSDVELVAYSNTNSFEFNNLSVDMSGYYTIEVKALTDPRISIVSTDAGTEESPVEKANYGSIYKAPAVNELFVKDGSLAWTIKVGDLTSFVEQHTNIEEDIIKVSTGASTNEKLVEETIKVIKKLVQKDKSDLDTVLSNFYKFRLQMNGVDLDIVPDKVDVYSITETTDGEGIKSRTYTKKDGNYSNEDVLLFSYDPTINPTGESEGNQTTAGVAYESGKFSIKVSALGNRIKGNEKGLITSVDSNYSKLIDVYKPNAPTPWAKDSQSLQELETEENVQNGSNEIVNGKLLWTLVTTDDSTIENFDYHKNYKITASISNSDNTQVVNEGVSREITIEDENILDKYNYYKNLTDGSMFGKTNEIIKNELYTLKINVVGTKDSSVLSTDKKVYLNSNSLTYTEPMCILENRGIEVSSGKLSWSKVNNSTQTNIYIYGPFTNDSGKLNYAPIEPDRVDYDLQNLESGSANSNYITDMKEWVANITNWKNGLGTEWTNAIAKNSTLAHVQEFKAVDNVTDFTLTGKAEFGAGSYIIRKQEIGNGKGVISTELSTDVGTNADAQNVVYDLYNKGISLEEGVYLTKPVYDYEVIATKLDVATKYQNADSRGQGNICWTLDGNFVWNEVSQANAFTVTLYKQGGSATNPDMKTLMIGDNQLQLINDNSNKYLSYILPDDINFNESGATYKITMSATHINANHEVSNNYFVGEQIESDEYGRAPYPTNVQIKGNGVVTWETNTDNINGYYLRINNNYENEISVSDKTYDLSNISEQGIINVYIKSKGISAILNSCYSPYIRVEKLATPNIKVENGVFMWGTDTTDISSTQPTYTHFELDYGSYNIKSEDLNPNVYTYPLYTEITDYDQEYSVTDDARLFASALEYNFRIKYRGDEGYATSEDSSERIFKIASPETQFKAIKLGYPTLDNVEMLGEGENRIKWNKVKNAFGYRAVVLAKIGEEIKKFDETYIIGQTNNHFVYSPENDYVELSITQVINTLNVSISGGASLQVYVQAIGTINSENQSETIYLSGSFSNKLDVSIPAVPTNLNYDSNTGILSWDTEENKTYNTQIAMTYEVNGVSQEEFEKYWLVTSDSYRLRENGAEATTQVGLGRYKEIKNRLIEYTIDSQQIDGETINTYTIYVTDTVFLYAKDTSDGYTPTEYQLTNFGINYSFAIEIMVGNENYSGIYKSRVVEFGGAYTFTVFASGDGSINLPYGVDTFARFNSIRYFADRHFVITEDISFADNQNNIIAWEMVTTEFTGSIDGRGKKLIGVTYSTANLNAAGAVEKVYYRAMFMKNSGSISNLNISLSSNWNEVYTNATIKFAGVAIQNEGTIDNVNITTTGIRVGVKGTIYNTRVAGMVVENTGTITNSSVTTGKNTTSQTNGIYALDYTEGKPTYVAGLVVENKLYATIDNCYFDGDITGNFVGGLTCVNAGKINSSYTLGTAHITDARLTDTAEQGDGQGIQYGGISSRVDRNAEITNSYSRMVVAINLITSNQITINLGSLVGNVSGQNITIKNCYTVVNYIFESGSKSNISTNAIYYFCGNLTNGTYSNNYYYVENFDDKIGSGTYTSNVANKVDSLEALCNAMTNIVDGENKIYFNSVTNEEDITTIYKYPMLVANAEKKPVTK